MTSEAMPLRLVILETVPVPHAQIEGQLFVVSTDIGGVGGRAKVRRESR